jgi:hypothetical protein
MAKNLWSGIVLAVGVIAGFWLWRASEDPGLGQGLTVLAATSGVVIGVLWWSHAQRVRRWRTALDAYAERSLARERIRVHEGRPMFLTQRRPSRTLSRTLSRTHSNRGG